MEITFPHAGNFEVLHRPHQGKEITGVVTVSLGGMVFQVDLPFFLHEGRWQFLDQGPDLLLIRRQPHEVQDTRTSLVIVCIIIIKLLKRSNLCVGLI